MSDYINAAAEDAILTSEGGNKGNVLVSDLGNWRGKDNTVTAEDDGDTQFVGGNIFAATQKPDDRGTIR